MDRERRGGGGVRSNCNLSGTPAKWGGGFQISEAEEEEGVLNSKLE